MVLAEVTRFLRDVSILVVEWMERSSEMSNKREIAMADDGLGEIISNSSAEELNKRVTPRRNLVEQWRACDNVGRVMR